jgi:predicted O-methyltransferase YrrM
MNSKLIVGSILRLVDFILIPFVYLAAYLLKGIRRVGVQRMPFSKMAFMRVGVFPIRNHYYEPFFNSDLLRFPLQMSRKLPGLNLNVNEQLDILKNFNFGDELKNLPLEKIDQLTFHLNNESFGNGDAEYLYSLIRTKTPARIIEIGSGNSTLLMNKAIAKNCEENSKYSCKLLCIEPYEFPCLEKAGVTVIRERVETIDAAIFSELKENDILFIDSSHMIRPQGDVIFELLELIPTLDTGVIVHIHDIFSPSDYPKRWVTDEVRFWNEQYLLEAFLTCNREWKIIGALNYLYKNHYEQLKTAFPTITQDPEPGSFYMQKIA